MERGILPGAVLKKSEDEWFGNATERSNDNSANILDAKRKIFHYVVSGHTFDNQPNSGITWHWGDGFFLLHSDMITGLKH